ncbi:MAG: hypothetical protein J5486_04265 [Bacteroidaceae bacterium]|nr:hypothetical protein [Bacteroidaceae bacterium]
MQQTIKVGQLVQPSALSRVMAAVKNLRVMTWEELYELKDATAVVAMSLLFVALFLGLMTMAAALQGGAL